MDREKLLDLEKSLISDTANYNMTEIYKSVIHDYCIEKGKPQDLTSKFVTMLMFSPSIVPCFAIALSYFEQKYNVCSVREKVRGSDIWNTILIY